jgi:site-specific DNA-cytosine methylase
VKTILSLYDFTGNWSAPYRAAGYDVIQWDLGLGQDVRLMERLDVDIHGILSAPPCTVFANAGARWPRTDQDMVNGLSTVDAVFRAVALYNPAWWALENPVGKLVRYIGPPAFKFDPCDFGDPYTKKTYLWGTFTKPEKNRVEPVLGSYTHKRMNSTMERKSRARSATPMGFARAFFEANP